MRRLTFLFGLLGAAVAKGQSLIERRYIPMPDDGKYAGMVIASLNPGVPEKETAGSIASPKDLKPKSGYCPLDGTKGEAVSIADFIAVTQTLPYMPSVETVVDTVVVKEAKYAALRCPHCGMLFTEHD